MRGVNQDFAFNIGMSLMKTKDISKKRKNLEKSEYVTSSVYINSRDISLTVTIDQGQRYILIVNIAENLK